MRPLALAGFVVTLGVVALSTLAVLAGVGGSAAASRGDDPVPVGNLVVIPDVTEARRVEVASLDGRQRRFLVTTPGSVEGAAWSPRGDRVAVSFRAGRGTRTMVFDGGGHLLARLRGGVFAGSWSPDGRHLLTDGSSRPACRNYLPVKRTLRLLVQDASSGRLVREFQLPTPPQSARDRSHDANFVTGIAWSPTDDRLAYFVSHYDCGNQRAGLGASSLYVTAMKSAQPTLIYGPTDAGGRPAWAPDGRSLAFTGGCLSGSNGSGCGRVTVVGADGRRARVVMRATAEDLAEPVIWPRQSTLVFGRLREYGPGAIGTFNLYTGKKSWLIQGRTQTESVVEWEPFKLSGDGRSVVADASDSWPTRQIVVARLDGSQSWRIPYEAIGDYRVVADVYVP